MVRKLVAATMASMVLSADARVGETSAECETRYGKGRFVELKLGAGLAEKRKDAAHPWSAMIYSTRGLKIQVVFENDKAVFLKYSNEPVLQLEADSPPALDLTAREIEFLKRANGAGWKSHRDPLLSKVAPTMKVWKTSDGTRFGGYDRDRKALFVCNSEFWQIVVGEIRARYEAGASGSAATRLEGM